MFPRSRVLSNGLALLLVSIRLVFGQGSSGRYDILKGTRGESSCTLQASIIEGCTSSTRRDFSPPSILDRDTTSLVPSACTCNAISFNIWSACTYSAGNSTLPNYMQWIQSCTTSGVDIESSMKFHEIQGIVGIAIPSWANLTVPGNTSFDLQRAVALSLSVGWTPFQIILPVAVAVMTLIISGVMFLIYRCWFARGSRRMGWPTGMRRLRLHTSRKVTTTFDKQADWEIDQDDGEPANGKPPFRDIPYGDIFRGHPRRSSRFLDPEMADVHESDNNSKMMLNSHSKTEKPQMGTNPFRVPTHPSVRMPWKRRPPQIKLVPATSRFRVDDVNKSACTSGNTEEGWDIISQMDNVSEAELANDIDQYVPPEVEEEMDLIAPAEREERDSHEVLVISKNGRPFTLESGTTNTTSINSQIKIISPSVSSASPRSTMRPVSTKPILSIPIPPPPPIHAAPAPPVTLWRTPERPSGSNRERQFPSHSFLPPITEAPLAQSHSSSNVLRRSPALARRSTNQESVSSIHASPAPVSSPDLITSTQVPPSYFDVRRAASPSSQLSAAFAFGSEEVFHEPYMGTTAIGHYRGLSTDDEASFYCTSPESVSMSVQPAIRVISRSPTDPAAFFPGPVRGAGYHRKYTQLAGDPF